MLCKTGHIGSAWGRIRGKVSLNPEQALRMFGFTMNPNAHGVIFRQYVYYDDNNHPHTGTFISNYFPASNPRTPLQQANRNRMQDAVEHWQNMPIDTKHSWNRRATDKHISGFNLHNREYLLKEDRMVLPNYDSGWVTIAPNEDKTFTHNVGGNVDNYLVNVIAYNESPHGIHNLGIGNLYFGDDFHGFHWRGLTNSIIKVKRAPGDAYVVKIRVRIWKY